MELQQVARSALNAWKQEQLDSQESTALIEEVSASVLQLLPHVDQTETLFSICPLSSRDFTHIKEQSQEPLDERAAKYLQAFRAVDEALEDVDFVPYASTDQGWFSPELELGGVWVDKEGEQEDEHYEDLFCLGLLFFCCLSSPRRRYYHCRPHHYHHC